VVVFEPFIISKRKRLELKLFACRVGSQKETSGKIQKSKMLQEKENEKVSIFKRTKTKASYKNIPNYSSFAHLFTYQIYKEDGW
jgi:hypothetical protein